MRVVVKTASNLQWKIVPDSCSEKGRHATCSGKLDFAVEKQCV
jgi:hypothetical protein